MTSGVHKHDTLLPAQFSKEDKVAFDIPGLVAPVAALKETAVHGAFETEQTRQRFDALNVAYVCTTRAEVRLHIIIDVQKPNGPEKPEGHGRAVHGAGHRGGHGVRPGLGPYRSPDFGVHPGHWKARRRRKTWRSVHSGDSGSMAFPDGSSPGVSGTCSAPTWVACPAAFGTAVHAQLSRIASAADAGRVLDQPWPWSRYSRSDWQDILQAVRGSWPTR